MMDSLSKDLLDHIVERLDTIHSRLERQNQEQAVLSGKLSGVSNQLEEEKVFMRDQLQDAQNEILRRLTELQTKLEEPRNLHGSTLQRVELRENTNYEAKGLQEHVPGAFSDEIADKVERSVQDMIRKEFERLNKHFKDSLDETQQNVGREVSESIADFTERTKVQLFAQTAGMDDKLDHIEATNEDLRRKMSTCEEKLATVERMTKQHVKDGILTAVNELKSSVVANIKPIFTKKTLVCLLLFSAVVLAVWYRSEGLTSVKSQIIHQMDNTKAELVSVTSDGTQDILDKLDNMCASVKSQIIHQIDNTKAELVSVTSDGTQNILDKLDNMCASVKSQIIHQMDKTKAELVSVTSDGTQNILEKLDNMGASVKSQIIHQMDNTKAELVSVNGDGIKHIMEKLENVGFSRWYVPNTQYTKHLEDIKAELVSLKKARTQHTPHKHQHEGHTSHTANKYEEFAKSMEDIKSEIALKTQTILDKLQTLANSMTEQSQSLKRQADTNFQKLKNTTTSTKRDIITFTEKENQLVRDRIAGPLPERKTYICDFYVENFQQLVKSGRVVTSLPWHINQFGTSVSGYVNFQYNGEMNLWLINGRNPREVGLEPKLYGTLKFKATITDTSGELPDHVVGEKTWTMNGEYIKDNKYWGADAGVVSCDELIKMEYGKKEGYDNDALLIRYEITVL